MRAGETSIEFDEAFFDRLGRSAELDRACRERAERIADRARSTAPTDSGDYKVGIVLERGVRNGRVVWLVKATDPKSMLVESRTGNLARAVRAVKA